MGLTERIEGLPEGAESVPEARLYPGEAELIFRLFAANEAVAMACQNERGEARVRLIPGGWRDLKLIRAKLQRLVDMLPCTIPREKQIAFVRTAQRTKFCIMQGPLAAKPKPNEEEVVTMRQLDALVMAAYEGKCLMCVDGQCGRCELGKTLDAIVVTDRADGSWSQIDIRREA